MRIFGIIKCRATAVQFGSFGIIAEEKKFCAQAHPAHGDSRVRKDHHQDQLLVGDGFWKAFQTVLTFDLALPNWMRLLSLLSCHSQRLCLWLHSLCRPTRPAAGQGPVQATCVAATKADAKHVAAVLPGSFEIFEQFVPVSAMVLFSPIVLFLSLAQKMEVGGPEMKVFTVWGNHSWEKRSGLHWGPTGSCWQKDVHCT